MRMLSRMLLSIQTFSGGSWRRKAPKVPVRALTGAHAHPNSSLCQVCRPRLRMESEGHWCPLHWRQPKPPPPQGFGAVAALEQDDGPRCLSALRVAVPCTEVTNPCPGRNRSGGSCTHGAPGSGSFPRRTADRAHGPHRSGGSRKCSRCAGIGRVSANDQADGSSSMGCRAVVWSGSLVTVPSGDTGVAAASNGRTLHVADQFLDQPRG